MVSLHHDHHGTLKATVIIYLTIVLLSAAKLFQLNISVFCPPKTPNCCFVQSSFSQGVICGRSNVCMQCMLTCAYVSVVMHSFFLLSPSVRTISPYNMNTYRIIIVLEWVIWCIALKLKPYPHLKGLWRQTSTLAWLHNCSYVYLPFLIPCFLKAKSRLLHSCFSRHCTVRDVDFYVNSSFSLSICLSLCQVVGADAVTTVWSWQALVDAVKCSRGINTSEGRNEKWVEKSGGEKKRTNAEK